MKVGGGQQALDPRFNQIPCPVLRTLVKEDLITVGPQGQVDLEQLQRALRGIGASNLVSKFLAGGGVNASSVPPDLILGSGKKELDIYRLRGSDLDHTGDTRILRDPNRSYSPERLQALLDLSSDGKTITLEDLAASNKRNVAEEPGGLRATVLGMAELSALLLIFGKRNEQGVKALKKEDLVSLFRDNKLPEGFEANKVGVLDVVGALAKMAFQRTFTVGGRALQGLDNATGVQGNLQKTGADGLRLALCPAMNGSMKGGAVSEAEIAQLHAPKPGAQQQVQN